MPPTSPACALVSDHSARSCGRSAANVAKPSMEQTCAAIRIRTGCMIGDTIRNPPCQLDWHGLRIVSPDLWLVPGPVDQFLGQAHGDGGADGRGDLLPDRRFPARHLLRRVHRATDGDSQPLRLRRQLLPLARAVDRVAHPAEHQDQDRAGADEGRRMLAHLQLDVGQLVAPAVQLRQRSVQTRSQVLDVALDLPRRLRLGWSVPVLHARRSFAHSTSSFRVRRVASSGVLTRLPHPKSPATVPTASTTPATISAAAHSAITVPSARAQATSIKLTAQRAQSPATPRPFAIATSFWTSARSSTFASSISFFASWVALSITWPTSWRFDIASNETDIDSVRAGNFSILRGAGSATFSSAMSLSSNHCARSSSGSSPRSARSSCNSSR